MVTRTLGGRFTEHDAVRSIEVWQAAEAFKVMTRVARRVVRILDRSAASSSVHSIHKNQHLPFISSTLRRNYVVRASPSPVRAYPFTSSSNNFYPLTPFLGKWFLSVHFDILSVFILDMVKALNFLHPSLPFFIRHPGRLNGQTRTLEFHGHLLRL